MSVGGLEEAAVRVVLEAAASAPSIYNSQPWSFRCTSRDFEVHADTSRVLPALDHDGRELALSCGAALFNLRAAIHAQGCLPATTLAPRLDRPNLLGVVRPVSSGTPDSRMTRLAEVTHRRRSARAAVWPAMIPATVVAALRHAAELEQAWFIVLDTEQRRALELLVIDAHHELDTDAGYRADRTKWSGRPDRHRDGLPGPSEHTPTGAFGPGNNGNKPAGTSSMSADQPLVVLLGSFTDRLVERLRVGQAMQRVLLTATLAGLQAGFVSAPLRVPATRKRLRSLAGAAIWPQVLLSLGHGAPSPRTPRRLVETLLMDERGAQSGAG